MPGFATEISLAVQRRNPVRVPRRDLVVQGSDTPVLAVTIYQRDTDTTPLDIGGASFRLALRRERDVRHFGGCWEYGWSYREALDARGLFAGAIIDGAAGRVDFQLAAATANIVNEVTSEPELDSQGGFVMDSQGQLITVSEAVQAIATLNDRLTGRYVFDLVMSYSVAPTTGIGYLVSVDNPPDYAQGNLTILQGIIEFAPGVPVPLIQRPELLGGIGVAS